MSGISPFCLYRISYSEALHLLTGLTGHILGMDEELHHLEDANILRQYACRNTLHVSDRETIFTSIFGLICRASVEVKAIYLRIARDI